MELEIGLEDILFEIWVYQYSKETLLDMYVSVRFWHNEPDIGANVIDIGILLNLVFVWIIILEYGWWFNKISKYFIKTILFSDIGLVFLSFVFF